MPRTSRKNKSKDTPESKSSSVSVKSMTKEFYAKLYRWYAWAQSTVLNVPVNSDQLNDTKLNEHLIRLMTRFIFVWFIKQKGLVAGELFEKESVARLLKNFDPMAGNNPEDCQSQRQSVTSYYRGILHNLFAIFNQPIRVREFGSTSQYRYGEYFTETGREEVQKLFAKTPFLNISFLECPDIDVPDEQIEPTNGFSLPCRAFVPNILFFNEDTEQPGLIPLLKQYRFTAKESTSDDAAAMLDPELLGNIFENILASHNPETRETARQMTGSFYTPREIVRYMTETSLSEYLKTKFPAINGSLIDRFIHDAEYPVELDANREALRKALLEVRILDPACGSGAFPIGAMQCILDLLHKLGAGCDKDYIHKKAIMENCLYGIDIQPVAVQITKLRCFISLLAEESPDESKPNCGIQPLPCLDMNFVQANALVPLVYGKNRIPTLLDGTWAEFKREKARYDKDRRHHCLDNSCKPQMRDIKEDNALRERLIRLLEQSGMATSETIGQLNAWNPHARNKAAAFFDAGWMFGIENGFDIVIGNPPYGATMTDEDKTVYKRTYQWLNKRYDIYMVFFELGIRLSNCVLCYITPDKWLSKSKSEAKRS